MQYDELKGHRTGNWGLRWQYTHAIYYSAVCLETGGVEAMPRAGNSSAETSVCFLQQLRQYLLRHRGKGPRAR